MEELQFFRLDDPIMKSQVFNSGIRKLIHTDAEKDKIVCGIFKSNAHKRNEYSKAWAENLQGPEGQRVNRALSVLMEESGS